MNSFPALMPTYNRADLAFERGEGCWLWTEDGRAFLDFGAGIATSSLGHGHPALAAAIAAQAARAIHVSNLYRVPDAERLARRLTLDCFADSVFFCNSGAEANEGLVKLIRRAQAEGGHPERFRVITFDGAFHGRTLAMLAATNNPKYLAGFGPRVDGFDPVPWGDVSAVAAAIGPETAGVLLEPIQGEGGIRPAPDGFLRDVRALCNRHGLLLGFDEVQCGMGRTGRMWAHQHSGVEPDVMSAAKGIAGGVPMGAVLARAALARHLRPGSHGTTFGGGPLACAAGNAVLDVVGAPGFLETVAARGARFRAGLEALVAAEGAVVADVRGRGLMLGVGLHVPNTDFAAACLAESLLVVAGGDNTVRLLPPLVVTDAECDEALLRLRRAAGRCRPAPHAAAEPLEGVAG